MKYSLSSLRKQGSSYLKFWMPAFAGMTTLLIALLFGVTHAEEPMPATNIHKTLASQTGWLNTLRPLKAEDLAGRIILIDFWTFCCINCMHVIPDLKYLEEKFGNDLTVIGVHSAKFKNERDTENIRNAILRYDLHHPVVNDFDFSIWQKFGVRAWPTFVLINPQGIIEQIYSGEGNRAETEADIEKLRQKYAGQFNKEPLPMALEKDKAAPSVLSFPGKLAFHEGSSDKFFDTLFISDSGHQRILGITPQGKINYTIGSGKEGFKDGDFDTAQFRRPQGMLFNWPYLYVADTENHALRRVDFSKQIVETIAGTGKQGYERTAKNAPALSTPLASPWDLAFYPDEKHIVIAMAGTHQLWSYDIEAKTVSVIAGNGRESIDDGSYPFNSLSQPSGLSAFGGKLYFVDSETSSLRVLENGNIKTLIGTGLFDFGYKEGKQGTALMQHAIGVFADSTGVYIADSYNHSIRRYDPATGILSNFAGNGERGTFNEPNDVLKVGDKLYVADTNNNAIRVIENGKVSTLKIAETANAAAPEWSEQLPNLESLPPVEIAEAARVSIALAKGWKINNDAPSYLAVYDAKKKPVANFDLAAVKKAPLTLPKLATGDYRLQSTLYYCEEKEGAQCLIKSFDVPLSVKAKGQSEITLKVN